MTEKELKRLRRADLLELLLEQTQENQQLLQQLEEARAQLADRAIRIEKAGSMAEAAVQLSGMMEATQDACNRYLENIRLRSSEADAYKERLAESFQNHCGACQKWQELLCAGQEKAQ